MQLPASATLADAPELLKTLQQALAQEGGAVQVDAGGLQNFDTSTLALLMQARRLARADGRAFEVVGAPPKLVQLARLYGVEELLSLSAPAEEPTGSSAAA